MSVEFRVVKMLASFRLEAEGELKRGVNCIVGPNGSGKTTLMKILAGLLKPDGGEVRYVGVRSRVYIGDFYVPPDAWGLDVVLAGRARFSSRPVGRLDVEKAREYAELLGAVEYLGRRWHTLSGGQRQKLVIAAGLASEADLLLLDEPLEGLHPRWRGEVVQVLKNVGRVVAISVHHWDVLDCCDYVVVIEDGGVKWRGPPGRLDKSLLAQSCLNIHNEK
ncbi:MAG: ATP-binding cassette domain-containing protein [Pyrobaculum sp.]